MVHGYSRLLDCCASVRNSKHMTDWTAIVCRRRGRMSKPRDFFNQNISSKVQFFEKLPWSIWVQVICRYCSVVFSVWSALIPVTVSDRWGWRSSAFWFSFFTKPSSNWVNNTVAVMVWRVATVRVVINTKICVLIGANFYKHLLHLRIGLWLRTGTMGFPSSSKSNSSRFWGPKIVAVDMRRGRGFSNIASSATLIRSLHEPIIWKNLTSKNRSLKKLQDCFVFERFLLYRAVEEERHSRICLVQPPELVHNNRQQWTAQLASFCPKSNCIRNHRRPLSEW